QGPAIHPRQDRDYRGGLGTPWKPLQLEGLPRGRRADVQDRPGVERLRRHEGEGQSTPQPSCQPEKSHSANDLLLDERRRAEGEGYEVAGACPANRLSRSTGAGCQDRGIAGVPLAVTPAGRRLSSYPARGALGDWATSRRQGEVLTWTLIAPYDFWEHATGPE